MNVYCFLVGPKLVWYQGLNDVRARSLSFCGLLIHIFSELKRHEGNVFKFQRHHFNKRKLLSYHMIRLDFQPLFGKRAGQIELIIGSTHLLTSTGELGKPPGGTPRNSWWECAALFFKSWPDFRPKNVVYQTRFQTWPLGRNYVFVT